MTRTGPLVSNANQSPVPVGNNPILLHFQRPNANVNRLQIKYTIFCSGSVVRALASDGGGGLFDLDGAKGANATHRVDVSGFDESLTDTSRARHIPTFIPAKFLKGLDNNMNTIPMLNIWTPPPDM